MIRSCWVGNLWGFKILCSVPLFLKAGSFDFDCMKRVFLQLHLTSCSHVLKFPMYVDIPDVRGLHLWFFNFMMVWRWFTWSRIYPSVFKFGCFPGLVVSGTILTWWGWWAGTLIGPVVMAEQRLCQAEVFDGLGVFMHFWLRIFSSRFLGLPWVYQDIIP
jgi:hypothetical protein